MNTEQREEIESAIKDLEDSKDIGVIDSLTWPEISTLIQFARQQLNLRVDGGKLRDGLWSKFGVSLDPYEIASIKAMVLECLTTTPEEKE